MVFAFGSWEKSRVQLHSKLADLENGVLTEHEKHHIYELEQFVKQQKQEEEKRMLLAVSEPPSQDNNCAEIPQSEKNDLSDHLTSYN